MLLATPSSHGLTTRETPRIRRYGRVYRVYREREREGSRTIGILRRRNVKLRITQAITSRLARVSARVSSSNYYDIHRRRRRSWETYLSLVYVVHLEHRRRKREENVPMSLEFPSPRTVIEIGAKSRGRSDATAVSPPRRPPLLILLITRLLVLSYRHRSIERTVCVCVCLISASEKLRFRGDSSPSGVVSPHQSDHFVRPY